MSVTSAKTHLSPEQAITSGEAVLDQLERQVERASFFTHTAIGRNALRLGETETFLYGVMDVLMTKGLISPEEVTPAVEKVRQEMAAQGDVPNAGVALRIDEPEEAQQLIKVNCAERMHICQGICCKLHFALAQEEVELGKVKWDLGQPYCIRQESDGRCTHQNRQTGACGIYAHRPSICRSYSCANDKRIWKDFENMELNYEWLEKNLNGSSRPTLARAQMQNIDILPIDEVSASVGDNDDGSPEGDNDQPS